MKKGHFWNRKLNAYNTIKSKAVTFGDSTACRFSSCKCKESCHIKDFNSFKVVGYIYVLFKTAKY